MRGIRTYALCVLASGLLGCDALQETTKAPFEATTELSQGTSQASSEFTKPTTDITNPTREFTSATLGLADLSNPDNNQTPDQTPERRRARAQLETLTAHAFENVRADIAKGGGEYLVSVATLAGISPDQHAQFTMLMHESYGMLYDRSQSTREAWSRVVAAAWSAGYGEH